MVSFYEEAAGIQSASLYIHIPFCASKCEYCAFYSVPAEKADTLGYVKRLSHELSRLPFKEAQTIYIGGGDPGTLSENELHLLLDSLSPWISGSVETTIEMNPEGITEKKLELLLDMGIHRVSLGVQSFDPAVRKILGRSGSVESVRKSLRMIGKIPEITLNADLITSVPGTKTSASLRDIDIMMETCSPGHISLYDLAIEEDTPLSYIYEESSQEDHLTPAWEYLSQLGYRHYEISNFCLPGREGKHNLRYWELRPYLGIGSSAVSGIVKHDHMIRFSCPPDVSAFTASGMEYAEPEYIDCLTVLKELVMVSLRTENGIPLAKIYDIYGKSAGSAVEARCSFWENSGHMTGSSLTEKGFLIMNEITLDFFHKADTLGITETVKPLDTFF